MEEKTAKLLAKWGPPPTEYVKEAKVTKEQERLLMDFSIGKYGIEFHELMYLYRTYLKDAPQTGMIKDCPTKIATWILGNLQHWARYKSTKFAYNLITKTKDRESQEWKDAHCNHTTKTGKKCNGLKFDKSNYCISHLYSHGCIQIVNGIQCGKKIELRGYCHEHNPHQHNNIIKINHQQKYKKPNYYEYIQSDTWKEKSKEARIRAKNRCQLCNRNNVILQVHHRTYERLGHELPEDLTVLCRDCHELFETHSPNRPSKQKN